MHDPESLKATHRAARMVAGLLSRDHSDDWLRPLREASAEDGLQLLVMALALQCSHLAVALHGDRAQDQLDLFAFTSLEYFQRHGGEPPC